MDNWDRGRPKVSTPEGMRSVTYISVLNGGKASDRRRKGRRQSEFFAVDEMEGKLSRRIKVERKLL